jgi:hypothetical protein
MTALLLSDRPRSFSENEARLQFVVHTKFRKDKAAQLVYDQDTNHAQWEGIKTQQMFVVAQSPYR